jgi:hypothetical protein
MGGLFSSKTPAPTPPTPPAAPVEEATFKPGGDDKGRESLKKKASGKKRLQIPLAGGTAKSAVQTGK